jgi:FtsP/CotA-like multicopper oxidase with cupredoxin domain
MKKTTLLLGVAVSVVAHLPAFAQPAATSANPCPRLSAGSMLTDPSSLWSKDGVLNVSLSYHTMADPDRSGRILYCLTTPDGMESPTLHVFPGDNLNVTINNKLPLPVTGINVPLKTSCAAAAQNDSSVNLHYHGTNTSPGCHGDDVIHTVINSGQSFTYNLRFPVDEPPGLYWYHPHVHGIAEGAVQGGATGAIVVEGIQNMQPATAGIPQRLLVVRDRTLPPGSPAPGVNNAPTWDVSVNYIPVNYPKYQPAVVVMRPGQRELWRVANTSADTILDLQLQFDGKPQTLQLVALDGVPTGSQDGTRQGTMVPKTHILIPTAGRAEFIVTGPGAGVKSAALMTLNIDTGPAGDSDPTRPLIAIYTSGNSALPPLVPAVSATPGVQRFEGVESLTPTVKRKLYFSEVISNPADPSSPTNFYITVDGAKPTLFDPNNPPAIVTTQGSVEDWVIENRATERHEFHFHQIHFLLLERSGVPVPPLDRQFLDMVDIPYWSGNAGDPYPNVKVRMDFRGTDIGDFVYHCHILGHEDNGMMAIIRVLPAK